LELQEGRKFFREKNPRNQEFQTIHIKTAGVEGKTQKSERKVGKKETRKWHENIKVQRGRPRERKKRQKEGELGSGWVGFLPSPLAPGGKNRNASRFLVREKGGASPM